MNTCKRRVLARRGALIWASPPVRENTDRGYCTDFDQGGRDGDLNKRIDLASPAMWQSRALATRPVNVSMCQSPSMNE